MGNSEFEYEYSIEPISKSELAIQQKCSVETIRLRFKEIGVDTGRKNILTIPQLKAYYDVYGKPITVKNKG